jgi:hypothetical protein
MRVKPVGELGFEAKRELTRLHVDGTSIVYATFFDGTGLSVYIKRDGRRADIEAFVPNGKMDNWTSYFAVGSGFGDGANSGYAATKHAKRVFPVECV